LVKTGAPGMSRKYDSFRAEKAMEWKICENADFSAFRRARSEKTTEMESVDFSDLEKCLK